MKVHNENNYTTIWVESTLENPMRLWLRQLGIIPSQTEDLTSVSEILIGSEPMDQPRFFAELKSLYIYLIIEEKNNETFTINKSL